MNPLVRAMLRSPLHRLFGKNTLLLTVTGRKTGRSYTVPVGRHRLPDGRYVVSAAGGWRHNLRGETDVRVTLGGRERAARAVEEQDPDRAAEVVKTMVDAAGARPVGLKVNVERPPTAAEIKPAIASRVIAYLQLTD